MKNLLILIVSLSFCLTANSKDIIKNEDKGMSVPKIETTIIVDCIEWNTTELNAMNVAVGPEPSTCCDNISLTSTFLGYTPQGCCTYEISVINFGTCDLVFFDATDLERIVPAQSSFKIEFTICDIDRKYYVGETNNQESACDRIELTCD